MIMPAMKIYTLGCAYITCRDKSKGKTNRQKERSGHGWIFIQSARIRFWRVRERERRLCLDYDRLILMVKMRRDIVK
jgi:hypothetical protein